MTADLLNSVEKWVESSGRALELRVARAARRAGAGTVELSFAYEDPKQHVEREGDVLAFFLWQGRGAAACAIELVVECKSSADKPWVAFYDRTHAKAGTLDDGAYFAYGRFTGLIEPLNELWQESQAFLVPRVAQHVAVAHDKSNNPAGDAVRQVLSATEARRMSYIEAQGRGGPRARVIIPAIVTAAPLVNCHLNSAGEVVVDRVDHLVVRGCRAADGKPCRVYVMNESYFHAFAGDLSQCAAIAAEHVRPV